MDTEGEDAYLAIGVHESLMVALEHSSGAVRVRAVEQLSRAISESKSTEEDGQSPGAFLSGFVRESLRVNRIACYHRMVMMITYTLGPHCPEVPGLFLSNRAYLWSWYFLLPYQCMRPPFPTVP